MACQALTGIAKGCLNNQGGIVSIWVNDSENVSTIAVDSTGHTITGLTATPVFTSFEFKRNVGNVVVDPKIELNNGSTYYEATLTLVFNRREAAKSRSLQILSEGQRYLDIIVLDANGIYWYIKDARLNGGTEESGTARADGSKLNVTFIADMDYRPYAVTKTAVTSVI